MARRGLNRRIDAVLLILYFFHTCSAKTESPTKYNSKSRENHSTEGTTTYPINPYVFSAEDYDILQDAESLQQALSIVSYESQKIQAKKPENELLEAEKVTQRVSYRPNPTQQLPVEKKYYEVPRKQSKTRVIDPEIAFTTVPSKLPTGTVASHHRKMPVSPTTTFPPLTERPLANFGKSSDNYPASSFDKTTWKRRNRIGMVAPNQEDLTSDRQPRPFSLSTAPNPTVSTRTAFATSPTVVVTAPTRYATTRQSVRRPTIRVEQPTTTVRQNNRPITRQQKLPINSTTLPLKLDQELQQTAPYATEFAHHFSQQEFPQAVVSYPTVPMRQYPFPVRQPQQSQTVHRPVPVSLISKEEITAYQPPVRRRNYIRRTTTTEPPVLVKQQPIVYEIPRRKPLIQSQNQPRKVQDDQTLPYGVIPARPSRRNNDRSIEQTRAPPRLHIQADVPPPTVRPEEKSDDPRGTLSQPIYVPPTESHHSSEKFDKEYSDSDYNDYPTSKESPRDKDNDKKQYSYSHVERYVEPLGDASNEQQADPSYEVVEDGQDYLERASSPKQVLQRGALKRVEPTDYNEQGLQYVDPPPADYDVHQQPEVAEAQHHPRGEAADLVQEAGHHHKEHHKPKKEHHESEQAGSEEHHAGQHHEHGEHGEKGYKEHHMHDEGKKGHHDKQKHDHHYDEKEGKDKEEHEEAGFQEHHEKGEEGEKKAGFSEKGHHDKGHSTKGEHVIHKKDEFEKKTEFFDEFNEGGDVEKDGGHHEEHHHKKGGHHKKGHHHEGEHEKHHGEKGHHDKGHHHHEKKGHHQDEGHDHHHHHEEKHGKKGGHADQKHWHHKKGDRRR